MQKARYSAREKIISKLLRTIFVVTIAPKYTIPCQVKEIWDANVSLAWQLGQATLTYLILKEAIKTIKRKDCVLAIASANLG